MSVFLHLLSFIVWLYATHQQVQGMLYPYESETREVKSLDGLWTFCTTPKDQAQDIGFSEKWFHSNHHEKMVWNRVWSSSIVNLPHAYNKMLLFFFSLENIVSWCLCPPVTTISQLIRQCETLLAGPGTEKHILCLKDGQMIDWKYLFDLEVSTIMP